jgi:hypothetical protein
VGGDTYSLTLWITCEVGRSRVPVGGEKAPLQPSRTCALPVACHPTGHFLQSFPASKPSNEFYSWKFVLRKWFTIIGEKTLPLCCCFVTCIETLEDPPPRRGGNYLITSITFMQGYWETGESRRQERRRGGCCSPPAPPPGERGIVTHGDPAIR